MSTTKSAPPRDQAEYTAWRAAQEAAKAAKQDAQPKQAKAPKQTAKQRRAERDAAAEQAANEWYRQEAERSRQADKEFYEAQERQRQADQARWNAWCKQATQTKRTKASKAADLAVSAHRIGSVEESYTAATRAGELYRKAGQTMADMARECPGMVDPTLWQYASAGYSHYGN